MDNTKKRTCNNCCYRDHSKKDYEGKECYKHKMQIPSLKNSCADHFFIGEYKADLFNEMLKWYKYRNYVEDHRDF